MPEQEELDIVRLPRTQFPPEIKAREWAEVYTDDITTCAGVRTKTYEHLSQVTFNAGDRGLADVLVSNVYRIGMRELDRLEREKDLEGMKTFGRTWLQELTAIAKRVT